MMRRAIGLKPTLQAGSRLPGLSVAMSAHDAPVNAFIQTPMFERGAGCLCNAAWVSADRAAAPSGVVTFLFTDVEGSTRRWEADADGMRAALAAHDEVLREAIEAHGGFMFKH